MQEHLQTFGSGGTGPDECAIAGAGESPGQRDARLLPGPMPVAEQAMHEAALLASPGKPRLTTTRALVGTAAIAAAVSVPDISAGAMDAPLMRVEMGEPRSSLPQPVWSPSARAASPVYEAAMAAAEVAPVPPVSASRPHLFGKEQTLPLQFLERGSERFDVAFAGMVVPSAVSVTVPADNPDQAPDDLREPAAALRSRLVDVPQISGARAFAPPRTHESPADRSSALSASGNGTVAMATEAVEAAFAGELDVSGGASGIVRSALPVASSGEGDAPLPAEVEVARAVPIPAPDAALTSSREAQIELVQKTQLDARVNGVRTGSVDFQQQSGTIALRLGSVVDMLRERYSTSDFDQIAGSGALDTYVSIAQLQAAGIPVSYSPAYDEIEFGIDYQDAPNAAKVQVEQIGAQTPVADSVMIDQIPR